MASQTNIWVHGLATQILFPADFPELPSVASPISRSITRDSSGSRFSPAFSANHTFYLTVATPTVLDEYYMLISGFVLLFEATDSVIDEVDIYEGDHLVQANTNLGWTGLHDKFDGTNYRTIALGSGIANGIVIAVSATFQSPSGNSLYGSLRIAGAGIMLVSGETVVGKIGGTVVPGI